MNQNAALDHRRTQVMGIDIGGANLKIADGHGRSHSRPFPMWIEFERLGDVLQCLIAEFCQQHGFELRFLAVTMTGELADCFASRRLGVQHIIDHVTRVVQPENVRIYAVGEDWLRPDQASRRHWDVAASNWHALATWVTRQTWFDAPAAIVLDIGSTTTDVIPVARPGVMTLARTDRDRLENYQLVYSGVERTPVCAIVGSLKLGGARVAVMNEVFAKTDDVYLCLDLVSENSRDSSTADGRPRTQEFARARLARMVGEDSESLNHEIINDMAHQIFSQQAKLIAEAIEYQLEFITESTKMSPEEIQIFVSGHGDFLAQAALARISFPITPTTFLSEVINGEVSRCGPAEAVAWLLERHLEKYPTQPTASI
ncbi:MAG: hypothetical protein KDB03_22105 [Planctomycetales bacterium]|nr:hypothetical protein [Planctomycetales bacterium]